MSAQVLILMPMDQAPNRIRHIRMAAKLSQQALADAIGTSKVTISSLEGGKMQLTLDYMKRIARIFGITPVDLLNEDEQNQMLRADELALLQAYRAAGPMQKDMIHRVAEPRPHYTAPPPNDQDGETPKSQAA